MAQNDTMALFKGEKWNDTGAPEFFRRMRRRDSHDVFYRLGSKRFGLTRADADTEDMLLENYGSYTAVWNAYERGQILLSPELAAALKAKISFLLHGQ